ncbi:MAG: UPF0182 family protein, partial [bacterium]
YLRIQEKGLEFRYVLIDEEAERKVNRSLYFSAAGLIFVLAWGKFLSRYHLMYSPWGAVSGPGWTDARIRLPAYNFTVVLMILLGLALLIPSLRNRMTGWLERKNIRKEQSPLILLVTLGLFILIVWSLAFIVVPGLFQWLVVEPNEITFEKPYISHNIHFTRAGFHLDNVEEREYPAAEVFTPEMVQKNQHLFANIRLWDQRALDAVYRQFQEIRLYYEFFDVDIDRYRYGNTYRQVMISAREMELSNLPEKSQTFVNQRFKYTHGYGLTLAPVNEFTSNGLPNLLIKDIPPRSMYPELEVKYPQIYYGELTRTPVVVNSREEEFDYPRGEENVYIRYAGKGGIPVSSFFRKFLFGWMFDGTRFLFSGYPTPESRIMFNRRIQERVKLLAPFIRFDDDPYIVLIDGKLFWIIDGYLTSRYFPYSEPFSSREIIDYREGGRTRSLTTPVGRHLSGVNYIRNSVKAVVDAFNGSVDFYVFDTEDPLIQTWRKIFPDLFKDKEELPAGLLAHIRYPKDMLLAQGLVYAKYHMNDPTVFYNQEDLWIRATEKYYDRVQPVEPYYVMWEPPGTDKPEFILMLPFTPKGRQVLIGWIAGMCDPENYGRFLAFKFPKEKRILGPQQVETKIDQDRFLSGQLTLWDQRGSRVIRGNVLAIPIEDTLLYIEPVYLQAETAAYPELRLVAVMHGDYLSYAQTFGEALAGLFEKAAPEGPQVEAPVPGRAGMKELILKANQAFEDYVRLLGEKRFHEAGQALESLEGALQKLREQPAAVE